MTFNAPVMDSEVRKLDQQAAKDLRRKVAGTSIRNESPNRLIDARLGYQTNNQMVHTSLGDLQPVDKEAAAAQRKKLTQANFSMGKQSPYYGTTNKAAFYSMRSNTHSQIQRKEAVDNNRRTNFISMGDGGFETPQKKFSFASVPNKGNNNDDSGAIKSMIDNLRKEHFKLGEQSPYMMRTSSTIGSGAGASNKKEIIPWAH